MALFLTLSWRLSLILGAESPMSISCVRNGEAPVTGGPRNHQKQTTISFYRGESIKAKRYIPK
jgi:hypothetical protein